MIDLAGVRTALAAVLEAAPLALRVYPMEPPVTAAMEYPCVVLGQPPLEYSNRAIGWEGIRLDLPCRLYCAGGSDEETLAELDSYRSPDGNKSLRAAIVAKDTLNGAVSYAEVTDVGPLQRDHDGGGRLAELSFPFTVWLLVNP